ncbi:endopeptidase La [[Mycoplasma] gypis]|uniref:Lon protease n=1 Tax=[Mycoplasma] gypis TaxID=92404 RepID=A0ABZ2RSF1_9BACT|nr:endopeptidase La [[Mycoplasma] gypis]MBN0919408.1 endopeptidase La [[Mycoplasma] gypis]
MKNLIIGVRNDLIVPGTLKDLKIGKANSLTILADAESKQENIVVASLKPYAFSKSQLTLDDYFPYATIAKIENIKNPEKKVKTVHFAGWKKVKLIALHNFEAGNDENGDPIIINNALAEWEEIKEYVSDVDLAAKLMRKLAETLNNFANHSLGKNDALEGLDDLILSNEVNVMYSFDMFFSNLDILDFESRYEIYAENDYVEKIQKLINSILKLHRLNQIDKEVDKTLRNELDDQQKDFLIRERMRILQKQLGEDEQDTEYEKTIESSELKLLIPESVKKAIAKEKSRLKNMMPSSPEANIAKNYIELLQLLPWRKVKSENLDIINAKKILDAHHYGIKEPKERIIEFISVLNHRKLQDENNRDFVNIPNDKEHLIDKNLFVSKDGRVNEAVQPMPILTLIGPPGVGKTTLVRSIAEALERPYVKISLGGVKDESEIRGHRRTYVGAMPGKIIAAIKKAGVSNPVVLLDEIDKMSSDFRGDPTSALLEVLDPEQNVNFQDHYLDIEYDLSKVLFIATANYFDRIPEALVDRVELIEINSYTSLEKLQIAKRHLIEKILQQNSLKPSQFQISDEVLDYIIKNYTRESGVRELSRLLDKIGRKIVVKILSKEVADDFVITTKEVTDFLGPIKFEESENDGEPQIGSVNGLAWTSYGGSTLAIEVTTFPGKEGLKLTGSLKEVMQESAQIALGYVRSHAKEFNIDFDFENISIHIHVPEGAVPKDGPSAGVTFTTAIISALSNRPVSNTIAMTGEITLRGKVLPIGGLKEKSLAAMKFGIKTIFIPKQNEKDLVNIPQEVKDAVEFHPVDKYTQIYDYIFKK